MYSFSYLEPFCCSMSSSNCCFLTCIRVSQDTGQVVWYSHLFQNFPQFLVIHTVKGFGIVNKAEIDVFLELSWFFNDPADVGNLISGSSAFSKTSLYFPKKISVVFFFLLCVRNVCLEGLKIPKCSLCLSNIESLVFINSFTGFTCHDMNRVSTPPDSGSTIYIAQSVSGHLKV